MSVSANDNRSRRSLDLPPGSKVLAWVVVVISVSVFVLLAVAAPTRASTALPKWNAGDYWSYDLTANAAPYGSSSGSWRMDVVGTESLTIGGSMFNAYHVKDNVSMTVTYGSSTATITVKGDSWYRTSDLAEAKQVVAFNFGGGLSPTTTTNIPPPSSPTPLSPGGSSARPQGIKTVLCYGRLNPPTLSNGTCT